MIAQLVAVSIPSPSSGVWHLGPVPIRGYALAIILGIVAAIWIGERRWQARGGRPGRSRTSRSGRCRSDWSAAGSTTWRPTTSSTSVRTATRGRSSTSGAAASGSGARSRSARSGRSSPPGGAGCGSRRWSTRWRRASWSPRRSGRWGNWFNQELFGKPTDLPWALEIDPEHRPAGYESEATFHPTFLYECVWNLGIFGVLIALDRRFKFGHGRMLALYVMAYTLGRGWIEMLRIDTVELDDVDGLRFNVWTSIVLFLVAAIYFVVSLRLRPGQEESVYDEGRGPQPAPPPSRGRRGPRRGPRPRVPTTRKHDRVHPAAP